MKLLQAVQAFSSVAIVAFSGFIGGEIAWLLESVQYDWQILGALTVIAAGLMAVAISLIIQCFPNSHQTQQEFDDLEVIEKDK